MNAAARQPPRRPPAPHPGAGVRVGNIEQLIADHVGRAAQNPGRRRQIYREAATHFLGLARDPRNADVAHRLQSVAMEFAAAEHQQPRLSQPTIEDFQQLLQDTDAALQGVGADELAMHAERRQIEEARPGHERVSIAPQSWHRDATLGRSCTIKWNPSNDERANGIAQTQTLAYWNGDKHEAQAITVDVGLVSPLNEAPTEGEFPTGARPYAIVMYGSDGNTTSVKFDIGRGVRFTVIGNYVSILVGMDSSEGLQAQMTVGASIGTFAAPTSAPVFLTAYVDDLANNDTTDFILVPSHAIQLFPIQADTIGGNFLLEFFGYGGGGSPVSVLEYPAGALTVSPIPLVGDVGFIKVTNQTGAAASCRLPFQLSL